jgi:three-Cys-motif partner protein
MSEDRKERDHQFGGEWTTLKLNVLRNYLQSYTKALRNQPFHKIYIDAFAGTGYRNAGEEDEDRAQNTLFPDMVHPEPQEFLDGSARIALQIMPHFDQYIFIERSPERCSNLENLKAQFPDLTDKIAIRQGDANAKIRDLCEMSWRWQRAVLFLDPYGMQVEWDTIQAIADTKAIDLWLLFPLGIGVNRLLAKSGDIPNSWRHRLNRLLGTEDWYNEFYQIQTTTTLFGEEKEFVIKAKMDVIGRYFNNRLKSIFAGVAEEPGVLRNSTNNPLYLLCFAVGNQRATGIALPIATHLLREVR